MGSVNKKMIHGESSFGISNKRIRAALTERGGHLGPVEFKLKNRWVSPFSLAPWQPKECEKGTPEILQILRGDFFCLPFGHEKKQKYVHGESANRTWKLKKAESDAFSLEMETKEPKGKILKQVSLREDHCAVYQEHVIRGVSGRYNFGHHAILDFPSDGKEYRINVSPFKYASVKPDDFTNPAMGEYSSLKTAARFDSLQSVEKIDGSNADLTRYPAREGFEDLIMLSSEMGPLAWTAATLDGYIWLSLKNPTVLPSTLFWISNGGRHQKPWKGLHRHRIGLEEVCSHFSDSLAVSRQDLLKNENVPTTRLFSKAKDTSVRIIYLVAEVPKSFGMVISVEPDPNFEQITVLGEKGQIKVKVDWQFVTQAITMDEVEVRQ